MNFYKVKISIYLKILTVCVRIYKYAHTHTPGNHDCGTLLPMPEKKEKETDFLQ